MNTLDSRKKLFLVALIVVLIIIAIAASAVIFLSIYEKNKEKKTVKDIKKIEKLIETIDSSLDSSTKNSKEYNFTILRLNESKKIISDKERYQNTIAGIERLQLQYTMSNNHDLYILINEKLPPIIRNAFPDQYNENDILYPCQDPKCATNPQPIEISSIINRIENSDIPDDGQKIIILGLTNASYVPFDERPFYYYHAANIMENSMLTSSSSAAQGIADELINYIKKAYPTYFPAGAEPELKK